MFESTCLHIDGSSGPTTLFNQGNDTFRMSTEDFVVDDSFLGEEGSSHGPMEFPHLAIGIESPGPYDSVVNNQFASV